MYELVVFDVDGTIIDSEKAYVSSLKRTLVEHGGRHAEDPELINSFGLKAYHTLEKFGIIDVEAAFACWMTYFLKETTKALIYPGILALLERTKKAGLATAIATSRMRDETEEALKQLELRGYFDTLVCADDVKNPKPDPECLSVLMDRYQTKAERTLYLGDTSIDAECAKRAGVHFILAAWGSRRQCVEGVQASCRNPEDIVF